MQELHFEYAHFLVFATLAMLFVSGALTIGRLFRADRPSLEKRRCYECGEIPTGSAWINMNPRFYLIALIFLSFAVELAFIFPVATVFRRFLDSGHGLLVLGEILVFVLILFAGLIFVWGRGDLEWLKAIAREDTREPPERSNRNRERKWDTHRSIFRQTSSPPGSTPCSTGAGSILSGTCSSAWPAAASN